MNEKKTKLIGWRVTEDLYKEINRMAYDENRSFSNMLEVLVREGIGVYTSVEYRPESGYAK